MKCLLAILIAGSLIAADKGQISGIVRDSSGAAVPEASSRRTLLPGRAAIVR